MVKRQNKKTHSKLLRELSKLWSDFKENTQTVETRWGNRLIWNYNGNGEHAVVSNYKWLRKVNTKQKHRKWHSIWKFQVLERVRFFIWITLLKCLGTRQTTSRWNGEEGRCEICCQNIYRRSTRLQVQSRSTLWEELEKLACMEFHVQIKHVYKEDNECANKMASMSLKQLGTRRFWNFPLRFVECFLQNDLEGCDTTRRVVTQFWTFAPFVTKNDVSRLEHLIQSAHDVFLLPCKS